MKKFFAASMLLAAVALLPSCGEEDGGNLCSTSWRTETQDELNAVSIASTAYSSSATIANCNNYKTAYQSYIDALKQFENCSTLNGQDRTDFENTLQSAETALAGLSCTSTNNNNNTTNNNNNSNPCAALIATTQDESQALSTAAAAYASDPSTANCNAYKAAAMDYIDAAQALVNCPALTQQERDAYQQSLDAAEASLAALVC